MHPWMIDPAWQNFSSLYREEISAQESRTALERVHHLTAALYFGIAALEAFLNQKMRTHMSGSHPESSIVDTLRKPTIKVKLTEWPEALLQKPISIPKQTFELLMLFNGMRGELTHPKTPGHELQEKLESVSPRAVTGAIAEYMVRFHEAHGSRYPYWMFGWNYLNPRTDSYEIMLINDQQFLFSLQALGFQVPGAAVAAAEKWKDQYLRTFSGFTEVFDALATMERCEPKVLRFPYQPILCRRWWTPEHQRTCGNITRQAIDVAMR